MPLAAEIGPRYGPVVDTGTVRIGLGPRAAGLLGVSGRCSSASNLATAALDGTFERLQASEAEVVQEPTEQPYGVRDCAIRDSAGQPDPHPGATLSGPEEVLRNG